MKANPIPSGSDVSIMASNSSNSNLGGSLNNIEHPKCKAREVRFTEERKFSLEYQLQYFDIIALLSMLISVVGVSMNWKYCSWMAVIVSFVNLSNFGSANDPKQIISSLMISIASLWLMYSKDPTPLFD